MFAAEVPRGNRGLAQVNVWSEGENKAVEDIVHSVPCSWGVNVTLSTRLGSTNPQPEIDPKISFPTTNGHASGPENPWPASLGPKTLGIRTAIRKIFRHGFHGLSQIPDGFPYP